MAVFNEPAKWAQALGATANVDVIPDTAGATDVDIAKIFPAVFSVPLAQGGKAIPRRTLNGILKLLGDWIYYIQNGGVPTYSADFDYTVGRFVSYNGGLYKCIQDNVHTAPHNPTDKDYWAELSDSSSIQVVIDTIATDLNGKADRSLSNVNNTGNILMAHNAMPSHVYDTLTLGPTNTQYTAPADGYFFLEKTVNSAGEWIYMGGIMGITIMSAAAGPGATLNAFMPVQKGQQIIIAYKATGNTQQFMFVYAVGSESEKV